MDCEEEYIRWKITHFYLELKDQKHQMDGSRSTIDKVDLL